MRRLNFGKLARDKIVENILEVGNLPIWRKLNEEEYLKELKKILEEAKEIPDAKNNEELLGEIADL